MTQVKFNRQQLNNPTPKGIAFWLNIVMAICTALSGWVSSVSFIPAQPSTIASSLLSLVVLVCMAIKPFFGVETTNKNVPIEQVGEMEVPEDKTK
jgi:hypothetical protein